MNYLLIGGIVIFVLFIVVAMVISSTAFSRFKGVVEELKYSINSSYITAYQFAQMIRDRFFDNSLAIITRKGQFSDAYDYKSNTIILSEETVDDKTVSALGVVCHEFGHAMQLKNKSKNFLKWVKLRKFVSVASSFIAPFMVSGLVMLFFESLTINYVGVLLIALAFSLFLLLLVFKFRLLKVEKEASRLGMNMLRELDVLDDVEMKNAKRVLDAAFMTYLGDFFRALLGWTMLTRKSDKP